MFTAPVRVSLDLTYVCDLRCIHCRTNTGEIPGHILRRMMSVERIRSLIRELDELQAFEITFTGGEPTLHPHFYEIAAAGRELRYASITLITNAAAHTRAQLDRILDSGIRSIRVSIDGTRDVFLAVRKKDVFDKVVENAKYLRDRVPNFKLLTTVMTTNLDNVFELVDYLRAEGFKRMDLILVRAHGRGGRNHLTLDEEQVAQVQRRFVAFQSSVHRRDFDLAFNAPYVGDEVESGPVYDVVMYPYLVKDASIAISATGDVTMSRLYSPAPIGNVKQESIAEIWHRGQTALADEAESFSNDKLRDIFWNFSSGEAEDPELSALLDRQIFEDAETV
jgi:MoaA/NifB/PqqE/SkfB family radical SAM enzyme